MPGKILVVDDEAAIRQMVCLALTQSGYQCVEAADVAEAQARLREAPPDLILLDWMLPGVSGVDYARWLRADKLTRDIPVILATARTGEGNKIKRLDAGQDRHLFLLSEAGSLSTLKSEEPKLKIR